MRRQTYLPSISYIITKLIYLEGTIIVTSGSNATNISSVDKGPTSNTPGSDNPSLAEFYSERVTNATSLRNEYAAWMRKLLFDHLAVTSGGVQLESSQAARHACLPNATSTGKCTVFGSSLRTHAEDAALVNGICAHGLELDDTFEESSLHPAVVVFPALLAVGEDLGADLNQIIDAAAVGYDIMCHIGVVLGAAESYSRGFHPTGVAGAIGASAAIAKLRNMDFGTTTQAIGLAADMAAGSLEFLSDGAWTKRLNAGHAAAVGIRATKLASAGFVAPANSLEGRDGFLYNYGHGFDSERVADWEYGEYAWNTSIKLYPCCRYMHGNLDLLLDLMENNPGLTPNEINRVELSVIEAGSRLVSTPREAKMQVNSQVDAQFNMFFGAALALTHSSASLADFKKAAQLSPSLVPLMERITCVTDPGLEAIFPDKWGAAVRVELRDGTVFEDRSDAFKGSPARRASTDDLIAKASSILKPEVAQALYELAHLPSETPVGTVVSEANGLLT